MNLARQCSSQVARYAAPSTARLWLRGALKSTVHTATGTLLAGMGTNGVQALAPQSWWPYTDGIAMSLNQCLAVFATSLLLAALKYVHASTAPGNTTPPMGD